MIESDRSSRDEDHFFDVLAGRTIGHSGAEALRQALMAEQQTVAEVEQAPSQPLSASELADRERTRLRLVQAGVLPAAPVKAMAHARTRVDEGSLAGLGAALHRFFFGANWPRQAAMFASVAAIATVIGLQWNHQRSDYEDGGAMRGGSVPELHAADPLQAAKALEAGLQAAGAEVMLVQINERTWLISAEVPREEAIAATRQVLARAGVEITGPPPFEVRVSRAK